MDLQEDYELKTAEAELGDALKAIHSSLSGKPGRSAHGVRLMRRSAIHSSSTSRSTAGSHTTILGDLDMAAFGQ